MPVTPTHLQGRAGSPCTAVPLPYGLLPQHQKSNFPKFVRAGIKVSHPVAAVAAMRPYPAALQLSGGPRMCLCCMSLSKKSWMGGTTLKAVVSGNINRTAGALLGIVLYRDTITRSTDTRTLFGDPRDPRDGMVSSAHMFDLVTCPVTVPQCCATCVDIYQRWLCSDC